MKHFQKLEKTTSCFTKEDISFEEKKEKLKDILLKIKQAITNLLDLPNNHKYYYYLPSEWAPCKKSLKMLQELVDEKMKIINKIQKKEIKEFIIKTVLEIEYKLEHVIPFRIGYREEEKTIKTLKRDLAWLVIF